jgi:chromosomal replication initiator protein
MPATKRLTILPISEVNKPGLTTISAKGSEMQTMAEKTWVAAQQFLRAKLHPDIYNLWFAPLRAISLESEVLTLQVANDFCELWLKDNYLGLIRDVLALTSHAPLNVKFQIASGDAPQSKSPAQLTEAVSQKPAPEITDRTPSSRELNFNPKSTFDTFVVGNNNTFAHAAAMAVSQSPGKAYNPLFLYGGVGLGKTHLLHAIGQYVVAHLKGARVTYLTSEKFTNEFIDAIQNNQLMRFRKKYRQSDVFLIDDIQFLAGKERIQEEFFHTFNSLHEARKQIVLTCDRAASEVPNLEQRLVSRFEWGLVTDMQPPDVETRLAILRKKEKVMGVELPEEILSFLAERIRTNIRRLEGALVRVASYASLTGKKITREVVEQLLREILQEEGRFSITIELIQKKVAEHFDIRLADMSSKRRPESIAFPRQIAMFLARQLTESSLNTIGEAFGGRDHGTVLHACRLVRDRMQIDASVRQKINYLERQLMR